jgi:glycosyltransferase involved in cell wall biosynthesis
LKKKIIIIGPAYPYRGGNSLFVSYVYDALKTDFNVKIYNYKLLYPSFLFPGTTQFDKSGEAVKKAPSERVVNSINPFNWIKVAQMLKKENADLIVFDWWHPFFGMCHSTISRLIKSKYKDKILFITENFISHEGNLIDKTLTKVGLKNASAFLALSGVVEKDLKEISDGRKIYRSELPVYECYKMTSTPQTKEDLGFSSENKVLLFFGYVRKYKGLDILLDSFKLILKEDPQMRLLVVGEFYDDPSIYLNQIKELGIEKEVTIVNQFVPNEEVGKYYSAADLVVLPYKSATQSGILNVAYAFLKPALVTDVGGLAEFIKEKETGLVVKPDSPESIAEGVKEFFKLSKHVNFAENIREASKENEFNKLNLLFKEIIKDTDK